MPKAPLTALELEARRQIYNQRRRRHRAEHIQDNVDGRPRTSDRDNDFDPLLEALKIHHGRKE